MRVTNKMIMNNASSNINTTKVFVNKRNTQMTSQKQIDRPSDDPVIAVRSLRLSTTLSQVTQYYEKNIPDSLQWIRVTETALTNMMAIGKDCKELATAGATGTKTQDDRKTILTQLQSLQAQLYAEGNADYANRTVFTGFRTDTQLTFTEDELKTKYRIDQSLSIEALMEEKRYYSGNVEVPTTQAEVLAPSDPTAANYKPISDISQSNYYRLRMNYRDVDTLNSLNITYGDGSGSFTISNTEDPATGVFGEVLGTQAPIATSGFTFVTYASEADWEAARGTKVLDANEIAFIKDTGDLVFGDDVAATLKSKNATVNIQYDKTGFNKGELRPEHYYNCKKMIDETGAPIEKNNVYTKYDENGNRIYFDIKYTVAAAQTLTINTEACDVFDSSIQRDVNEMIDAVQKAINAYDKISTLKDMKNETKYAAEEDQEWLDTWIKAAEKEFDFYSDNMKKLFNDQMGKFDKYYAKINLCITDLGCKEQSLDLTKVRVGDQSETVKGLQSKNDDIDLSQIIIDYTAAYTAYQASLTAAGKLGDSTLLNYI